MKETFAFFPYATKVKNILQVIQFKSNAFKRIKYKFYLIYLLAWLVSKHKTLKYSLARDVTG